MKKILMLLISSIVLSSSYAQNVTNLSNNVVIKNEDKAKVDKFKNEETLAISKHREDMRVKRQALNEKENKLLAQITEAKSVGNLSNEQKENFKQQHIVIKKESQSLNQINNDFLKNIQDNRTKFYSSFQK